MLEKVDNRTYLGLLDLAVSFVKYCDALMRESLLMSVLMVRELDLLEQFRDMCLVCERLRLVLSLVC